MLCNLVLTGTGLLGRQLRALGQAALPNLRELECSFSHNPGDYDVDDEDEDDDVGNLVDCIASLSSLTALISLSLPCEMLNQGDLEAIASPRS